AGREPRRPARRHRRRRRVPHERERPRARDPRGRDGAPGEVPPADGPRLRIRRELRAAHARAAAGRAVTDLPRGALTMTAGPAVLDTPSRRRAGAGLRGIATVDAQEVDRSARLAQMRSGELGSVHSWEL